MIGTTTAFNVLFAESTAKIVASKTVVYNVLLDDAFVPGSDSIQIKSDHTTLIDAAANQCIGSHAVRILPQ